MISDLFPTKEALRTEVRAATKELLNPLRGPIETKLRGNLVLSDDATEVSGSVNLLWDEIAQVLPSVSGEDWKGYHSLLLQELLGPDYQVTHHFNNNQATYGKTGYYLTITVR